MSMIRGREDNAAPTISIMTLPCFIFTQDNNVINRYDPTDEIAALDYDASTPAN